MVLWKMFSFSRSWKWHGSSQLTNTDELIFQRGRQPTTRWESTVDFNNKRWWKSFWMGLRKDRMSRVQKHGIKDCQRIHMWNHGQSFPRNIEQHQNRTWFSEDLCIFGTIQGVSDLNDAIGDWDSEFPQIANRHWPHTWARAPSSRLK